MLESHQFNDMVINGLEITFTILNTAGAVAAADGTAGDG